MRWLRRRWRRRQAEAVRAADRAVEESRERLADAQRMGDEVSEVAQSLRELRRRNHFGPMITEALRGMR